MGSALGGKLRAGAFKALALGLHLFNRQERKKITSVIWRNYALNKIRFFPSHKVDTPISLSFSRSDVMVAK